MPYQHPSMSQANDGQNPTTESEVAQVCFYQAWKNMEHYYQSVLTLSRH